MIVIVDHDEVAQLQVTGSTSSFASDALHSTAITEETIGMVIDQLETWLIENGSCMGLGHCKTNGIRESLAEWASSDLDARGILTFWMAGGDAVNSLAEIKPSADAPKRRR